MLLVFAPAVLALLTLPVFAQRSSPEPLPTPNEAPSAQTSGLFLPPSSDPGAQKAGQLLQQMVTALGGDSYLNMRTMEQTGRTYSFYHGEPTGAGAPFWRFWRAPDKDRVELTKHRDWVQLYVGDQGYEITFRGTAKLEQDQLEDYLRRRNHSLSWVLHTWLRQPGIAVFYEGEGIAERKQADLVSVITAQNDAVTIAIDSNTHLPLRIQFTWRDPKTRDRTDEAEGYDNYRSVQGIMTPFSIMRYKNGDPSNQRFITSASYNRELPDSLFAAQLTSPPGKKPEASSRK